MFCSKNWTISFQNIKKWKRREIDATVRVIKPHRALFDLIFELLD